MSARSALLNAFRPATELDDPERFAGRSSQVRELTDALHSTGATPLIYGDRGLGKSSLAVQTQLIAMGNVELLHQIGAARLALAPEDHYLTFYVTCTDATPTFQDLLQQLVNSAESIENTEDNTPKGQLIDRTTRRKLSLKAVELEATKNYKIETRRLSYQDLNLEEKLLQLCELLTKSYKQPVLFIIDELDRMADNRGLASFVKAYSSGNLKFLLVGIASNVADLLADHKSLERRLVPVLVPPMRPEDLVEIIVKAEAHLAQEGLPQRFAPAGMQELARVASGFPWFVHVLGQQCLVDADEQGRNIIDRKHVERAAKQIVANRFAQQFSDLYQVAVRDSAPRERVLRAFAEWRAPDIPTAEVYRALTYKLDMRNGSTYKTHLCKPDYGDVLMVPAFQQRGLVRFRNEMFKAYVRMRSSIFIDVDTEVRRAFD